jgi:hypothetical protein
MGKVKHIHLVLSIEGVLSRSDRELKSDHCKWITRADGSRMTPTELRTELCKALAAGMKVIPMSSKCKHNPDGTCPGHESYEDESEVANG